MLIKIRNDIQKITKNVLLTLFSPTKLKLSVNKFFSNFYKEIH